MTKQTINVGTDPNDRSGDSLRTAFQKVNANFTELYTALGLAADTTLNLGAFEFVGSVMTTTDSTPIIIDQATTVTSDLTVGGDIVPNIANGSNLGSPAKPFRSLYVSNNTVFFGGIPLSLEPGTNELRVNNVPISQNITYTDIPNAPIDISDLTDTENLLTGGVDLSGYATEEYVDNAIPTDVSDLTDTDGLLGGGGGGAGPVQPYLELTNSPFIVQPVVLGSPVTVSTTGEGSGAEVEVVIGEGPVITSVTVTSPGTGYTVGQRYRVWFYQIGGNNDDSSIEFEVATVSSGGLLTVTDVAFTGEAAANTPGTYSNLGMELRASPGDSIGPGLTLVRSYQRALFNIEAEAQYDTNNNTSPLGTEWNSEGWGDLTGFNTRTYTTFREALNGAVGNNIIGAELVMHDTINDQYYKFSFSNWGGNNGGSYAYTRTLIERDPNYFIKENYATANNVDVIEDDSTLQIGITRGNNQGIYNPFTEEGWDDEVSPDGTLWNIDGWDDLTNVETRTYTTFDDVYGGQGIGNKIPGSKTIMYVPSIEKYYAIQWLSWTQNNQGGGFSYLRYEIDLTKLDEGVRFADGTVQKTAYIPTNVKLTAPGERRIEEAYGYKEVTVTVTTTGNTITTTAANSNESGTWEVNIVATGTANAALLALSQGDAFYQIEVSADQTTWIKGDVGGYGPSTIQIVFNDGPVGPTFDSGDTVYYRILSGGDPVTWWNKDDLPGGSSDFRGAVIDYHAYIPGRGTIVGTIHIVDDDGDENITHTEVASGDSDLEYSDLWYVTSEGEIQYRQLDNNSRTLKIQWTAKVFYGSEYYND
jgi:hypothetical protein